MTAPHEALWYDTLQGRAVRCTLCPHRCRLAEGRPGICLTRVNEGGRLVSRNYLRPVSCAYDPIEKKPLYHFRPGSVIFSTGPNGCNLKCAFCQNCEISQQLLPVAQVAPDELFAALRRSPSIGIAYTYSEPYIWFETIMELGRRVRETGLANVMVTNGFMEPGPLAQLLEVVDAMNIDIKSIEPGFYRRLCRARLEPVLRSCEQVKKRAHLEITNLLIPGENDSPQQIAQLARWVSGHLGRDTPLHLSRYFPRHRMSAPPTPQASLLRAYEIARQQLDYVYLGNTDAGDKGNTCCAGCAELLVERRGYETKVTAALVGRPAGRTGRCGTCGRENNIVLA